MTELNDLQKLENAAIQIRGHVIHRTSDLEIFIDTYIAYHFSPIEEKGIELAALILAPRVTFDNKIQIFNYLIEHYNPNFKEKFKNYNSDLGKIRDERNIVAHFQIHTHPKAVADFINNGVVYFVKLRPSTKPSKIGKMELIKYDEERVNKIVALIYDYTDAIKALVQAKAKNT